HQGGAAHQRDQRHGDGEDRVTLAAIARAFVTPAALVGGEQFALLRGVAGIGATALQPGAHEEALQTRFPKQTVEGAPGSGREHPPERDVWRRGQDKEKQMYKTWIALAGAGVLAAACSTTGTGNVERNAAGG